MSVHNNYSVDVDPWVRLRKLSKFSAMTLVTLSGALSCWGARSSSSRNGLLTTGFFFLTKLRFSLLKSSCIMPKSPVYLFLAT